MAKVALAGVSKWRPDFSQMEKSIGIRMGTRCCLCLFVEGIAAERRNLSDTVLRYRMQVQ